MSEIHTLDWEAVADYVAAGNLVQLRVADDFDVAEVSILYGDADTEVEVAIRCLGCRYLDTRRLADHSPGSGSIFEAYLHTKSPLLDDFYAQRLEGKAGGLCDEHDLMARAWKHLEIVGEVSLNIICSGCEYTITMLRGAAAVGRHNRSGTFHPGGGERS